MTTPVDHRRRSTLLAALVALVALVAGCGIPVDDQPRDIPAVDQVSLGDRPSDQAAPTDERSLQVYFLSASRTRADELLQPAPRAVGPSLPAVLGALLAGPTPEEQGRRFRTAIPTGTKLLSARVGEDGTATVDLDRSFDQTLGDTQRKAVAQIVFTATGVEGVDAVQLLVEGRPREWPRGDGFFQREPLTRSAYPDLDPTSQPEYPPAPTAPPTTATPSTTAAAPVTTGG